MHIDETPPTKGSAYSGLIGDLYKRYWLELCRYIAQQFGAGPPEPEDVIQSAFERFSSLDEPEAVENPRAFLYRIARNIVIDYHRGAKVRRQHIDQEQQSEENQSRDDLDPERVLSAREALTMIESVIAGLPAVQRQLVVLSRFYEVSYAEISRRTGISQTEVKRQVASGLAACDKALAKAENRSRGNE